MENKKTLTITKVKFVGKWVEFWFEEEKGHKAELDADFEPTGKEVENWLHSCKGSKLWELVDKSELDDEIMDHGFAGKITKWEFVSPNWNLVSITKSGS